MLVTYLNIYLLQLACGSIKFVNITTVFKYYNVAMVGGNLISYSLKLVTFSVAPVLRLYTKRFIVLSRSDIKKISSPIHIGIYPGQDYL